MLNKLKFNNLVISNKKGIQQSRIQTINKLVHKIRKLKTLLEKRPEDGKCKERIRKSTESMEVLKKFKRVEMMKQVLLMEKLPAAIITNGLSTPDEIAVALLAMNKVMQGLIKRFKTELQLTNAADEKWREELRENSKRRQKIERTEQKKLKRTALKEQKAAGRKRKEWLEQNIESNEEVSGKKTEISTVGNWKVEEIEVPNKPIAQTECTHKIPEKKVHNKVVAPNNHNEVKKTPKLKRSQEEDSGERVGNLMTNKKPKTDEEKSQKVTTFKDNDESSEEEKISLQQNEMDIESDSDGSVTESHVVDPFFVTDTGENYLSTAVINRNSSQQQNNDEDIQKGRHMIKLSGTSQKRTNFQKQNKWTNNNEKEVSRKHYSDRRQENKKPWQKDNDNNERKLYQNNRTSQQQKRPQQDRFSNNTKGKIGQPSSIAKVDEKLHPSWAAKQKQKPIITGFQGKKITFDDDGDTNNIQINTSSQSNAKPKTDSLHPSWVAKQKQKPTIAAFQGKKITFDNDD